MDRTTHVGRALISVLLVTAVAVGWALWIAAKGGGLPHLGGERYHVAVVLPTATSLATGSRVTMAGVDVGRVTNVERAGMGARVELRFDDDAVTPLRTDSRVRLRQRTPVGETYISIDAGNAETSYASGAVIPVSQAEEYVDVDQILSTLHGRTRERARETIRSLGGALDGRGDDLNRLLSDGSSFVDSGARVLDIVHRDRAKVSRLVDRLGSVASALGERDQAISVLAHKGLAGLRAIRDNDEALAAVLRDLPDTLERVRSTGTVLRNVSARATPTVDELAGALSDLRGAVRNLDPAMRAGSSVLGPLEGAAPKLRTVLSDATALSGPLPETLPALHKTICELAPMARYIKPYMPDPLGIVLGLGSGSNPYDATGHTVRLAPIFSDNSVSGLPAPLLEAQSTLLHGGLLSKVNALNYDFYMEPGELAKTYAKSDKPIGPEDTPETGFVYPRVHADC